jgi:hypothetical protein
MPMCVMLLMFTLDCMCFLAIVFCPQTSSDLNNTLNAMHALWTTDEEAGQRQYGLDFHNASYFGYAHFFHASYQDSDHFHEGLGFLSQVSESFAGGNLFDCYSFQP